MESFKELKSRYGNLYIEQLELEAESKAEAEEHLRKALEQARLDGEAGQGKLASKLTAHTWETCRNNVHALIELTPKESGVH